MTKRSLKSLSTALATLSHCRKGVPGQLVIQLTDRCNALCPQCGMRVTETFKRSTLDDAKIYRIIDTAAARGIQVLSFTGGEPMLLTDALFDLILYAGKAGIEYIRTGTNGFIFTNSHMPGFASRVHRIAENLAQTKIRNFWISIDSSLPQRHEKMRGFKGVIRGIERALPTFHSYGVYPSANLGINRNMGEGILPSLSSDASDWERDRFYHACEAAFRMFFRFVIDMGFTIANVCYPMSMDEKIASDEPTPVYSATSTDAVVRFTHAEKALLFKALENVLPSVRPYIRAFTPRCALHALQRQYTQTALPYPCRGGIDFYFISAQNGDTYPCGFRGNENLGKFWSLLSNGKKPHKMCHQCDWECFRDPSEMFGPILEGWSHPVALYRRYKRDKRFFKLWVEDLRYYHACDFFDGRKPLDPERLSLSVRKNSRRVEI